MFRQKPSFPSALSGQGMQALAMELIPKLGMVVATNHDVTNSKKGGMPKPDATCHKPKRNFLLREEKT